MAAPAAPHRRGSILRGLRPPRGLLLARPARSGSSILVRASAAAPAPDLAAGLAALEKLKDVKIQRANDGVEVPLPQTLGVSELCCARELALSLA